jgi:lysophospholipase L1-like esterase
MRSRWRRSVAKASLVLVGLVLGLLVAEGIARMAGFDPGIHVIYRENFRLSENPRLRYELQPLSKDGDTRINSAGMRDHEHALAKPAGVYRIAIVGDSIAYGLTVDQRVAFPQQLERMLNDRSPDGPRFEVLNLGVSGYNIDQIVERSRSLGLAHSPDLIIYAYSLNDPQTFSLELQGLTAMSREAETKLRPRQTLLKWLSKSRVFLLLWRSFQQPWTRPVRPARQSPDYLAVVSGRHVEYFEFLHAGEPWQRLQSGLAEMAELGGDPDGGPRVLLAVLPIHLGTQGPYPLSGLHRRILAEAERHALETFDLAPFLMGGRGTTQGAFFNDPFHPSAEGHRRLAQGFLGWLQDAGILRPTPRLQP